MGVRRNITPSSRESRGPRLTLSMSRPAPLTELAASPATFFTRPSSSCRAADGPSADLVKAACWSLANLTCGHLLPNVSCCPHDGKPGRAHRTWAQHPPKVGRSGVGSHQQGYVACTLSNTASRVQLTHLTASGRSGKLAGLPQRRPRGSPTVSVRSLRTQQRAKSQCICTSPSNGRVPGLPGVLTLTEKMPDPSECQQASRLPRRGVSSGLQTARPRSGRLRLRIDIQRRV
jgi:hypothetical protein